MRHASKTERKKDNPGEPSKSATYQRLKLKRCVAFAHLISRDILIRALLKQRFSKVKL